MTLWKNQTKISVHKYKFVCENMLILDGIFCLEIFYFFFFTKILFTAQVTFLLTNFTPKRALVCPLGEPNYLI